MVEEVVMEMEKMELKGVTSTGAGTGLEDQVETKQEVV